MRKLSFTILVMAMLFAFAMASMAASTHSPPAMIDTTSSNYVSTSTMTTATTAAATATFSQTTRWPNANICIAATAAYFQVDLETPYVLESPQAIRPSTQSDFAYAILNYTNTTPDFEHWTRLAGLQPSTSTSSWLKASGFMSPSPRASPATLREEPMNIERRTAATARNAPILMRV